jgi:hypothetical protein
MNSTGTGRAEPRATDFNIMAKWLRTPSPIVTRSNNKEKSMKRIKWPQALALGLLITACQASNEPAEPAPSGTVQSVESPTESWQCRNDLEISCDAKDCEMSQDFTPMSVSFDDTGSISVCAYSGCSEGIATISRGESFIVLTGHDLPFSTSPARAQNPSDIAIILDTRDQVAILKTSSFAHPLHCVKS